MVKEKTKIECKNDISMDMKKALSIMLDIDFSNFDDVYDNSCMGIMFDSLEKARKMKYAYEFLKEKFDWEEKIKFSIYRYDDGWYSIETGNAFKNAPFEIVGDIEKVE